MPARIVDGDALWRSDKLAKVEPSWYRAEYANLIPLALADGTFECNPKRVWADVYSYNRPDIDIGDVEKILNEFEKVGLLAKVEKNGKIWGYWIGIESRLPPEAHRDRYKNGIGKLIANEITRERCIYFLQDTESLFIKIGFCYFDRLRDRIKEIQTGASGKLKLMGVIRNIKRGLENDLHKKWEQYQTNSESEWFKNHSSIVSYIEENSEIIDFTEVTSFIKPIQNQAKMGATPDRIGLDWIGLDRIGLDRIAADKDSDFSNIRKVYRDVIHKSCSSRKDYVRQYTKYCQEYGEELVLIACRLWAEDNQWRDKKPDLHFFFQDISNWIEAAKEESSNSLDEKTNYERQQKEIEVAFATAQETETHKLLKIQDAEREREKQAIAELEKDPYAF